MISLQALLWALAISAVAVLNIMEILPDWTTVTAVLTLPFLATAKAMQCPLIRRDGR